MGSSCVPKSEASPIWFPHLSSSLPPISPISPGLSIFFCCCSWSLLQIWPQLCPGLMRRSGPAGSINPRSSGLRRPDSIARPPTHYHLELTSAGSPTPGHTHMCHLICTQRPVTDKASVISQSGHTKAEHSPDPAFHQALVLILPFSLSSRPQHEPALPSLVFIPFIYSFKQALNEPLVVLGIT